MSPTVSGHDNRDGNALSAITMLSYELIYLASLIFLIRLLLIVKEGLTLSGLWEINIRLLSSKIN